MATFLPFVLVVTVAIVSPCVAKIQLGRLKDFRQFFSVAFGEYFFAAVEEEECCDVAGRVCLRVQIFTSVVGDVAKTFFSLALPRFINLTRRKLGSVLWKGAFSL